MLKSLVIKQLRQLISGLRRGRNGKIRTGASFALYAGMMIFLELYFFGIFTALFASLCPAMAEAGGMDAYYGTACGAALLFGVLGGVFTTYSMLYGARDNEFLLSMPVPPAKILAARLIGVYLMSLLSALSVLLPAFVLSWIFAFPGAAGLIFQLAALALVPLAAVTVSCVLGWLIALVSSRVRKKNVVQTVLSLLLLAAYFLVYFRITRAVGNIVEDPGILTAFVRKIPPLTWIGRAMTGDGLVFAACAAAILAAFAAVCAVLSASFLRLATVRRGGKTVRYREKRARRLSPFRAYLRKELLRLRSSSVYMLNGCLGTVMMPLAGIAALVKADWLAEKLSRLGSLSGLIPVFLCIAVCFLASMNDLTAPSVSLEARTLWIPRTAPVDLWAPLKAKIALQLLVTLPPAAVCAVCLSAALKVGPLAAALVLAAAGAFVFFSALAGLCWGLLLPNLTWVNETAAVKQGYGILLATLSSGGEAVAAGLAAAAVGFFAGALWGLAVFFLVTAACCAGTVVWLKTVGVRRYGTVG
ncbi:MAG: hypothetical protein IJL69_01050 [Oscillospiraceae bacterium]|nr:hypothetical protein [Oscillospiraceae bacterium]